MDWQQELSSFAPLQAASVEYFAPLRDMEQAITIYNRALSNFQTDSPDVALIALRKLVATYSLFGQASLLLGCYYVSHQQPDDARDLIERAQLAGLDPADYEKAERYLDEIRHLQQAGKNVPTAGGKPVETPAVIPPTVVLQKSKRTSRMRMASEREVQAIMRRAQNTDAEETHVQMAYHPIEYLRAATPVLGILLGIVALFILGAFFGPGLLNLNQQLDSKTRLEWLMPRLEALSVQDPALVALLADYDAWIQTTVTPAVSASLATSANPTATTGTASSSATLPSATTSPGDSAVTLTTAGTTTVPTSTADPGAGTTADPVLAALQAADRLYQKAVTIKTSNVIVAAESLASAQSLLADLPAGTAASGVTLSAGDLTVKVDHLYASLYQPAAEKLRVLGETAFNKSQYATSLKYYIRAYHLYPAAYGGGVAYYCGRNNQLLGNQKAAKPYYDYILKHFPGKDIAVSARNRLTEMGY